jgi:enoyl-CoA hydratase/carnithine racemase
MGDDGTIDDSTRLLDDLNSLPCRPGRSFWAVTVLQAIEQFDAGPIWAFEQFPVDIDQPGLTKSTLYFGAVTQAALEATIAAIQRVRMAENFGEVQSRYQNAPFSPLLRPRPEYGRISLGDNRIFQGGRVHHRPLLRAAQRAFSVDRHDAQLISRRIRSSDSQPGVLTKMFGIALYVYGGMIDDNAAGLLPTSVPGMRVDILGVRNNAVCISTSDGKGVWITHVRRPKSRSDQALWPKVPAIMGLLVLGILKQEDISRLRWSLPGQWSAVPYASFQEIWIDMQPHEGSSKTAYLYFNFYNGAMSTDQCSQLIDAMDFILSESTDESPIQAVVLMGGSYFSNGIALNVIESAICPATESWLNINRINDVVHHILHEFPAHGIVTIAALRGNAAAGGVALAAACDVVISGSSVVLNPAYRAVGLFGSEYHTLSYPGRCGELKAQKIIREMLPMDAQQAQSAGLVDYVFPGTGTTLDDYIRSHIAYMLKPGILKRGFWKRSVDLSQPALARARARELQEMSLDFWSVRSVRYHERRRAFVRKIPASSTPLRFATHRRIHEPDKRDAEELDSFDSVAHFVKLAEVQLVANLRDPGQVADVQPSSLPSNGLIHSQSDHIDSLSISHHSSAKPASMFACYYKPPDEDLLTPPGTPLRSRRSPDSEYPMASAMDPRDISPLLSPFTPAREVGTFSFF